MNRSPVLNYFRILLILLHPKLLSEYHVYFTAKRKLITRQIEIPESGRRALMKALDYTALTIAIIGAVNWGLVGIFRFDLIAALFGNMSWFSRLVYILVGLSGLYLLSLYGRIRNES